MGLSQLRDCPACPEVNRDARELLRKSVALLSDLRQLPMTSSYRDDTLVVDLHRAAGRSATVAPNTHDALASW
jgi:hypothetical protein